VKTKNGVAAKMTTYFGITLKSDNLFWNYTMSRPEITLHIPTTNM